MLACGEDVVGGPGPDEGPWRFVVRFDEGHDIGLRIGGGAVNSPADTAFGDEGEEALELVDRGGPGLSGLLCAEPVGI